MLVNVTPSRLAAVAITGITLSAAFSSGLHYQARWQARYAGHRSYTTTAEPVRRSWTPRTWAVGFLHAAGLRPTRCNVRFVTAWEAAEGGHWHNAALHNPLDTTERAPGSWAMNSVGVQAYPTWREGLAANVTTLRNGHYGQILAALAAGHDARRAAGAVAASPWGTGTFAASC